tara:strand:+ start:2035 stop:2190 length:156 start_codon:yes stop_codon:yes gene_type:complete
MPAYMYKKKAKPKAPKKARKPKGTHTMPNGTVMTGKTHTKNSKPVTRKKKK